MQSLPSFKPKPNPDDNPYPVPSYNLITLPQLTLTPYQQLPWFLLPRNPEKVAILQEMPIVQELLLVGLGNRRSRPYLMVSFFSCILEYILTLPVRFQLTL